MRLRGPCLVPPENRNCVLSSTGSAWQRVPGRRTQHRCASLAVGNAAGATIDEQRRRRLGRAGVGLSLTRVSHSSPTGIQSLGKPMSDCVTEEMSAQVGRRLGSPSAPLSDVGPFRASETICSWQLQRSGESAHCVLRAVGDTVELHIAMSDEVVMSQQCRDREEASAVAHAWWSALLDRGWVEHASDVTLRAKPDRRASSTRARHRD